VVTRFGAKLQIYTTEYLKIGIDRPQRKPYLAETAVKAVIQ
jgi:hypothetical protein